MKKSLDIPDIRNKLGPITSMIKFLEDGNFEWALKELEQSKKAVNYLAARNVFKLSEIPEFVCMKETVLRYDKEEDHFYRHAGNWYVDYKVVDGKYISIDPYPDGSSNLDGVELVPTTKAKWKKDNKGYTY